VRAWLFLEVTLVTLLHRVSLAMVQLIPIEKSYVKALLQCPPNVVLSGPFKKSFPASHGTDFIHGPIGFFRGISAASRQSVSGIGAKSEGFAPPGELLSKTRG
jgi:hypothetical protein